MPSIAPLSNQSSVEGSSPPQGPSSPLTTPIQSSNSSITPGEQSSCISCFLQFFTSLWNWIIGLCCSAATEEPSTPFTVEGDLSFNAEQTTLLSKLFSEKNLDVFNQANREVTVDGKPVHIMRHRGVSTFFEVDLFSDLTFRLDPQYDESIKEQYAQKQTIKKVCSEDSSLDALIVPECALLNFGAFHVIAEKKCSVPINLSTYRACLEKYEEYGNDIVHIAIQLSTLICKANLSNISWKTVPLFESDDGKPKVFINHPILIAGYGFKEGLIGWPSSSEDLSQPPGLMHMIPDFAKAIFSTAANTLPIEEFASTREALKTEFDKIDAILQRQQSIRAFYWEHGITVDSPAIPTTFLESVDPFYEPMIHAINQTISEQGDLYFKMIFEREWICRTNQEKELASLLEKSGIVHSIIKDYDTAKKLDIVLRRGTGYNNWIVQF